MRAPTDFSGPKGLLKGFNARNRTIAGPNGVNRTPDIIASEGSHVPAKKESVATPENYFQVIPKSGSKAWSKPF